MCICYLCPHYINFLDRPLERVSENDSEKGFFLKKKLRIKS